MIHLSLADIDHDPFSSRDIGLRVLAGALSRPTRAARRRKIASVVRLCRVGRDVSTVIVGGIWGLASGTIAGTAIAGLWVSVARVGAAIALGG